MLIYLKSPESGQYRLGSGGEPVNVEELVDHLRSYNLDYDEGPVEVHISSGVSSHDALAALEHAGIRGWVESHGCIRGGGGAAIRATIAYSCDVPSENKLWALFERLNRYGAQPPAWG